MARDKATGALASAIALVVEDGDRKMNSDANFSLLRQVITALLTSGAASAYVSGDQAVAIAAGIVAAINVLWSVYAHYGMRKVPERAVVTAIAPSVAVAKAQSIPAAK